MLRYAKNMKAICQYQPCSKEFEAKRSTATFCCGTCRVNQARIKKSGATSTTKPSHGRPNKPACIEITPDPKIPKGLKVTSKPISDDDWLGVEMPPTNRKGFVTLPRKITPAKSLPTSVRSVLDKLPQYKH